MTYWLCTSVDPDRLYLLELPGDATHQDAHLAVLVASDVPGARFWVRQLDLLRMARTGPPSWELVDP